MMALEKLAVQGVQVVRFERHSHTLGEVQIAMARDMAGSAPIHRGASDHALNAQVLQGQQGLCPGGRQNQTACRFRVHAVVFREKENSVLVQFRVQLAPALVAGDGVQRAGL